MAVQALLRNSQKYARARPHTWTLGLVLFCYNSRPADSSAVEIANILPATVLLVHLHDAPLYEFR
jgi:hypothetical protein